MEELHELRESDGFGELASEEQRLRRWSVWMGEHAGDPDHSYRGAESFNDLVGRVRRVQELLIADGEERVLAVSHGIFLRFFFAHVLLGEAFGPPHAPRLWQLVSHNCALTSFSRSEIGAEDPWVGEWRCLTWMERPWDPP